MRSRVVSRLFTSPNLSESATLVRQEAGCRNEYGEYIEGCESRNDIAVITAPSSSGKQLVLPSAGGRKKPVASGQRKVSKPLTVMSATCWNT